MFRKIYNFFLLSEFRLSRYEILMLILIAYCFSVAVRFYYPIEMYKNDNFIYNGAPIITSSDGFWYAEGARDRIDGEVSRLSPTSVPLAILTSIIYNITPFTFEEIIFFIPVFFSSLLVVPIILIGKEMGNSLLGFIAALLSVVAYGFYTRTMAGYYDDDFFSLTLPFWLLYFMIANVNKDRDSSPTETLRRYAPLNDTTLILGIATIFFYHWWYQNGPIIITGLLGTMFFFTMLFYRKNRQAWIFLIFGFIANLKTLFLLKLIIVVVMLVGWIFFKNNQKIRIWVMAFYGVIASVMFINSGLFVELVQKFDSYISKKVTAVSSEDYGLHYYNSLQTVSESKMIDFDHFFMMSSWSEWFFLLGTFGYFIAAFRYKYLWFGFPLYFIGLSAADAGVRFVSYGTPLVVLGFAYIAFLMGDKIAKLYKISLFYPLFGFASLIYPFYESYAFIKNTIPGSTLSRYEVAVLADMKNIATRDDYIVSWWDFGYPVRYYADVLTHSDGGMQNGNLTYLESLALTSTSQAMAANLLREGIEIKEIIAKDGLESTGGTFGDIMKYGNSGEEKVAAEMIKKLSADDYAPANRTRDIYWMMTYRILPIFGTIEQFSNYDLQTKELNRNAYFYFTHNVSESENELDLGGGIIVDKGLGILKNAMGFAKIKTIYKVSESMSGEVSTSRFDLHNDGILYLINIEGTNSMVVANEEMFRSNFIQMFVFNNYNPKYFEPIIVNPMMKIYKLKDRTETISPIESTHSGERSSKSPS